MNYIACLSTNVLHLLQVSPDLQHNTIDLKKSLKTSTNNLKSKEENRTLIGVNGYQHKWTQNSVH